MIGEIIPESCIHLCEEAICARNHFSIFTAEEAQALAEASVRNGQIWSASLCRDRYLPEFIRVQGSDLKPETLRALQYQVENDEWYHGGAQVEA